MKSNHAYIDKGAEKFQKRFLVSTVVFKIFLLILFQDIIILIASDKMITSVFQILIMCI